VLGNRLLAGRGSRWVRGIIEGLLLLLIVLPAPCGHVPAAEEDGATQQQRDGAAQPQGDQARHAQQQRLVLDDDTQRWRCDYVRGRLVRLFPSALDFWLRLRAEFGSSSV
jgi:hypothetical protein